MSPTSGLRPVVLLVLAALALGGDAAPRPLEATAAAVSERVELVAVDGDVHAARDLIVALGGHVEVESGGRVQALVPPSALPALELHRDTVRIDTPGRFVPLQTSPAITPASELIGATAWQEAGFSGYGVKVGILDAGFLGYEVLLGSGLPTTVEARSFRADGEIRASTEHGRRAAEVVHGIAPGAALYLANFSTVTELSSAVDYLIEEGVDVVSFSLGYIHNGPGDGDGPVNEIVSRATEAGITWAVASGNWAQQHWEGAYRDNDGDGFHEFNGGAEMNLHDFNAGDLITASLRWDEPWGAACSDFDLELFSPTGALLRAARGIQACVQDPVESLQILATQTGTYGIRVIRAAGSVPRTIDLMVVGTPDRGHPLSINQPFGSLSEPADHPDVVTVGALTVAVDRTEAPYSSRGPTTDGRSKPDLLAPTGAGASSPALAFGGTSAAAPHVAGVMALLKEAHPNAGRTALDGLLQARALPVTPTQSGSGAPRVNLGTLVGLGPLLPAGGIEARLLGDIPDEGLALVQYEGPSGYPPRFIHRLVDYRPVAGIYTLNVASQQWRAYIPGAPAFVNIGFPQFTDAQILVLVMG